MENVALKVTSSAVLGGTIDEIGGGKFANGAITGAYGMLFNELMHDDDDPRKSVKNYGGKRELVATGVVSSIILVGGVGFSIEAGTIIYKGEEYGIVSFGIGGGLDISGGLSFLRIYADPDNFDIYDLEGKSGQGNASIFIFAGSWEAPSYEEQILDTYRAKSFGLEAGLPELWGGGSWMSTSTKIIPPSKNPTSYDLYKKRPGGY